MVLNNTFHKFYPIFAGMPGLFIFCGIVDYNLLSFQYPTIFFSWHPFVGNVLELNTWSSYYR